MSSVLAQADAWSSLTVAHEEDAGPEDEKTPLNSREVSPEKVERGRFSGDGGRGGSSQGGGGGRARVEPRSATAQELAASRLAQHDTGRTGIDLRRSRQSYWLLFLFLASIGFDVLLLFDLTGAMSVSATPQDEEYGETPRTLARVGQLVTVCFTLLVGSYSLIVHRRWQVSLPRYAAAAATQFALLPEYTAIALVLDVGKLAYPYGARVGLVTLMMLTRVASIAILLRLGFVAGVRRGLVSQKQLPEMLRTLVSLEGVEVRGLGDVAPQPERPLSVDLLEKLVVFLTPRRLGERLKEGAGLARSSAMPLTFFALCLTLFAAVTEFERLQTTQEPMLPPAVVARMVEESANETARLNWRRPDEQPVPPVTTFLVIVSGVNYAVGAKILGQAFNPAINDQCARDVQTRCEAHSLRTVMPSTSVPNWIAALTGVSPSMHGILGNIGVGRFPFDSIFAQARTLGVDTGVSSSPWLVNLIKPHLPLLTGDGRVSSSADGVYETTMHASTETVDGRRRAATLYAARMNAGTVQNSERVRTHPGRYAFFVTQLTNVDSIGHRRGSGSTTYEEAMRDVRDFVIDLMRELPSNSVLLVAADHGHELKGGTGGTSEVVARAPMFSFRKTVAHGASSLELSEIARASGFSATSAAEPPPPPPGGADTAGAAPRDEESGLSALDLAPTLALLAGLPVPRSSEGGFIPRMFANARREMWSYHARDLLYQRHHLTRTLLKYEMLPEEGLRPLIDLEQDANAAIAAGGATPLEQAVAWLSATREVNEALNEAKAVLATRYAMRNLGVSSCLGVLIISLVLYILHGMTFADPFFILFYRRYARSRHRTFWQIPDVIALLWAVAIVGTYYFITTTIYLTLLMGVWQFSAFDSSHVHDTFSRRRYFIATLLPGIVSQWALTRSFTLYYKKPFVPPPRQPSLMLTALRWTVKVRLIFSAQVESREVGKVYLIRLYVAAVATFAMVLLFISSSAASFPLPYMYQPKHIDETTWDARFQTLTYKIMSLPLLAGALYNLHLWSGTKLTLTEVEALFKLKRRKEARLLGVADLDEEEEAEAARLRAAASSADGSGAMSGAGGLGGEKRAWQSAASAAEESQLAEEEGMLRALVRQHQMGELSVEGLQEIEHLLLRTRTQSTLLSEKLGEARRKLDARVLERSEAIAAVKSSKAFLGRGFRDIEMLLEAGFRELEDQRSSFMANRRKKLRQRIERDRARRAQRTAGYRGANADYADEVADEPEKAESDSDVSDGESIASFDSQALASMDFDELQARLAANEAKERKGMTQFTDTKEKKALSAEAEAADIRRTEYATLAQSKMGKQAQLDELTERVGKEQGASAVVQDRLEAALADEQQALQEWEVMDTQLQEAELERATLIAAKTKAKELALEKAQVAESSLEGLKDNYRELRRREERMLREVKEAEASGEQLSADLELQAEKLRRERQMWTERIAAAEEDRRLLFGEAQAVELHMREEKARKMDAQADAAHFRDLFRTQM